MRCNQGISVLHKRNATIVHKGMAEKNCDAAHLPCEA